MIRRIIVDSRQDLKLVDPDASLRSRITEFSSTRSTPWVSDKRRVRARDVAEAMVIEIARSGPIPPLLSHDLVMC